MFFQRALIAASLVLAAMTTANPAQAAGPTVHLFWTEGCPHCHAEQEFLPTLKERYPELTVKEYEISGNEANLSLFKRVGAALGTEFQGVPVTVIGSGYVIGFRDEATSGYEIERRLNEAVAAAEPDVLSELGKEVAEVLPPAKEKDARAGIPEVVTLPLVGEVRLSGMSLTLLTVTMALLDGFNPCAMWVLLFLLSLLVGMPDRRRAWILGVAFIAASALVYYVFLAAWLQAFLFLGFVAWIRILVAAVALGAGYYYLRDLVVNRDGGCHVVGDGLRDRVFRRAKEAIASRSLLLSVIGIVSLAVAVNLVELVCSAGLPAVYTHVLTQSHLPWWQYHLHLLVYVLVFMADDLFIFFTAMWFLQLTGIQHKYTRWARLVGGVLMIVIGIVLLFRPSWLSFA